MTTYNEVRDHLYMLKGKTIKLGLDNVTALLSHLGNPQNDFPSVHIAGTNGKGSVSSLLSSCMWRSGENWGMFTSPHLIELTERFRVGDVSVTKKELLDAWGQIEPYMQELAECGLRVNRSPFREKLHRRHYGMKFLLIQAFE